MLWCAHNERIAQLPCIRGRGGGGGESASSEVSPAMQVSGAHDRGQNFLELHAYYSLKLSGQSQQARKDAPQQTCGRDGLRGPHVPRAKGIGFWNSEGAAGQGVCWRGRPLGRGRVQRAHSPHSLPRSSPQIIVQESQSNYYDCRLTLQPAVDPMITPDGYVFSREAILENLLQQKKAIKRKLAAWEAQQQEGADLVRGTPALHRCGAMPPCLAGAPAAWRAMQHAPRPTHPARMPLTSGLL